MRVFCFILRQNSANKNFDVHFFVIIVRKEKNLKKKKKHLEYAYR